MRPPSKFLTSVQVGHDASLVDSPSIESAKGKAIFSNDNGKEQSHIECHGNEHQEIVGA